MTDEAPDGVRDPDEETGAPGDPAAQPPPEADAQPTTPPEDVVHAAEREPSPGGGEDLSELSKDDLLDRAAAAGIEGRSSMNKQELVDALQSGGDGPERRIG